MNETKQKLKNYCYSLFFLDRVNKIKNTPINPQNEILIYEDLVNFFHIYDEIRPNLKKSIKTFLSNLSISEETLVSYENEFKPIMDLFSEYMQPIERTSSEIEECKNDNKHMMKLKGLMNRTDEEELHAIIQNKINSGFLKKTAFYKALNEINKNEIKKLRENHSLLQNQIDSKTKENDEFKEKIKNLDSKLKEFDQNLIIANEKSIVLNNKNLSLHENLKNLKDLNEKLSQQIDEYRQQNNNLNQNIDISKEKNSTLNEQNRLLEEKLTNLEKENNKLIEDQHEKTIKSKPMKKYNKNSKEQLEALINEVSYLRNLNIYEHR